MEHFATYLFSGGGTGGHLFPGIAVAEELLARDGRARILFAGSPRDVEAQIVASQGYEHRALSVEPSTTLRRRPARFLWRYFKASRVAREMVQHERPECVIGLGGFASVPLVSAAAKLRVPTLLLEQNIVPGRATRWLSRRASIICLSFSETVGEINPRAKVCVTGNPVRRQIVENESIPNEPSTLLVLGGSQGARAINEAVPAACGMLRSQLAGWKIVHQTGPEECEQVRRRYAQLNQNATVEPFFGDLSEWYRKASLVVSRAGATTLAELACAGCPAVLIPYPNSLGDHQLLNARAFESRGAGCVVEQNSDSAQTADVLTAHLTRLLEQPSLRETMGEAMQAMAKPRAAHEVVDRVLELTRRGDGVMG